MVEMAGIEPASKNLFLQISTCLVYPLKFPHIIAEKQATTLGISYSWSRSENTLTHVHR